MSFKVSGFNTLTLMTLTVYSLTVRGAPQWITAYPQENLFVLISNSAEGVYIQMLMPGDERKVYDVGKMFDHELLHLRSSMQWNMLAWRWSVDRVVQCFREARLLLYCKSSKNHFQPSVHPFSSTYPTQDHGGAACYSIYNRARGRAGCRDVHEIHD